ncbi:MAG: hypothetical protein A2Y33_16450 [Spirochaetes bacterium GWF1_51_8]|nr:MAG: hypothetical protein A2Y33_16450 [Spirochaetes bacterium GWF1_51_8]
MRRFLTVLLLAVFTVPLAAVKLEFKDPVGRKYRIKSLITQKVYYKNKNMGTQETMFKSVMEVVDVNGKTAHYVGKYFDFSKKEDYHESYKLENSYEVTEFYKNNLGVMTVPPQFLMPTLRSVPTFPSYDVAPGATWKSKAEEIIVGSASNTIHVDMDVSYKFVGMVTNSGKKLALLLIDYHIAHHPDNDPELASFTGYSHIDYLWNVELGAPDSYTDEFNFTFTYKNGDTWRIEGGSEALVETVEDVTNIEKQKLVTEIADNLKNKPGADIKTTDDGIIVNLGMILFDIDKATLKPESKAILDKLAEVLRKYPGLDIEVSGHTDISGQEKWNQTLSEMRAKTVADYLVVKGISPERISYIGYGSKKPVAPNNTEEGRILNRRVEIKIITKE